jgi:UDP-GlcNAc:undecaprenyl-phosphate GlcNAc-1-phosphate transferase
MPYLGGIGVAVATLTAGAGTALVGGLLDPALGVLLGAAAAVAVLGLVDDVRPLGPGLRLCVETSAAVMVVAVGGCPELIGWGGTDAALAVAWIVFTTNAINLLDNTDGAAASLCAISGGFLCGIALSGGADGLGMVTSALAGACLGFLGHNWHPARIFLGDAGSLFLGFTLSSAAVVLHADPDGPTGLLGAWLATLAATVDTVLVMLSRRMAGRPLLRGGTDHAAHRLRRVGLTVPQVVLLMCGVATLVCVTGALVLSGSPPGIVFGGAAVAGAAVVGSLIRLPAVGPLVPGPAGQRVPRQRLRARRPRIADQARTREADGTSAPSPSGRNPMARE